MPRRPLQLPGAGILVRMCGLGGLDRARKDRERGYSTYRANRHTPSYWSGGLDSPHGWELPDDRRIFLYDHLGGPFPHPYNYSSGDENLERSRLRFYESTVRIVHERPGRRAPEPYIGRMMGADTRDANDWHHWQRRPRSAIRYPEYSLSHGPKSPDPMQTDLNLSRGSPFTQRSEMPYPPHTSPLNSPQGTGTAYLYNHDRFDDLAFPSDQTTGFPISDPTTSTSERGSYVRQAPRAFRAHHDGQSLDAHGASIYRDDVTRGDNNARRFSIYDDESDDVIDTEDDLDSGYDNDRHPRYATTDISHAGNRYSDGGAQANNGDHVDERW